MKGTRSHRLALSITSVLFIMAGLFVSLATYVSKRIWPDPSGITREITVTELADDAEPPALNPSAPAVSPPPRPDPLPARTHVPNVVATLNQPKAPDIGGSNALALPLSAVVRPVSVSIASIGTHVFGPPLRPDNDIADLQPAQVTPPAPDGRGEGGDVFSVFSMGVPADDTPPDVQDDLYAGLTAPAPGPTAQDLHDAEYQMDMQIAALARPIDRPVPPPPSVEVFALASDSPPPAPDAVFAMAEPEIWPQRVDQKAVLAVSHALGAPDAATAPVPVAKIDRMARPAAPIPITEPDQIQMVSGVGGLGLLPPPAVPTDTDAELAHQIAKVLAATPLPLPGEQAALNQGRSAFAPHASPRPLQRQRAEPEPAPQAEQIAAPAAPLIEPPVPTVTPASAPASPSIRSDDGRQRMSVIGIYHADTAAWALLELSDGRIVKATKGTDVFDVRVARIGSDKIWIRDGGTEKGLSAGQVLVLD